MLRVCVVSPLYSTCPHSLDMQLMSELSFCSGGAGEHSADDAEFAKAVGVRLRKRPQTSHVLAYLDPTRFTHTRDYFGPAGGGPSEAGSVAVCSFLLRSKHIIRHCRGPTQEGVCNPSLHGHAACVFRIGTACELRVKVARLIGLGDSLVKSPEKPICIPGKGTRI